MGLYSWFVKNEDKIIKMIDVVAVLCIIAVCYPKWCEIWYQFGGNIYTLLHQ